jgi:hypothetical protein
MMANAGVMVVQKRRVKIVHGASQGREDASQDLAGACPKALPIPECISMGNLACLCKPAMVIQIGESSHAEAVPMTQQVA